jgi:REP element-mobilizing transposase RayT
LATFLITFACYGAHMHGAEEGSVDRHHNHFRAPLVEPNRRRLSAEQRLLSGLPYFLDEPRRQVVLKAVISRCFQSDWHVLAAHIRSNHVHVIVGGDEQPEFIMTQLKSAASRRLNELGFDDSDRKRWARHGSTRTLWNQEDVESAVRYVLDGQGEPMATFQG